MEKQPKRRGILLVHHKDSNSGSPRVLAQIAQVARATGLECTILTTPGGGFLSQVQGARHWWLRSRFGRGTRLPSSMAFLLLQLEECLFLMKARREGIRSVYLNTLYHPLPSLLARALFARRVVHAHEVPLPLGVGKTLARIALWSGQRVVFPSRFALEKLGAAGNPRAQVVPCAVEDLPDPSDPISRFRTSRVVLAASLAPYKGARLFVELARLIPDIPFRLALDATREECLQVFGALPANLELLCQSQDRAEIFGDAAVVVCMTIPRLREETFGLSVAEAMSWGIPVVVPPSGGVVERVDPGRNGILNDPEDLDGMARSIRSILDSEEGYLEMARNAKAAPSTLKEFTGLMEAILQAP